SDVAFKVGAIRDQALRRAQDPATDAELKPQLAKLADSADKLRKEIVATKEGGAITGEERLREHMDQLYGSVLFYGGRPAPYLTARTDALERELVDVEKSYADLVAGDFAATNEVLKGKGQPPIVLPAAAPEAAGGQGPKKGGDFERDENPFERD